MSQSIPDTMQAVAIDRFGGPEVLTWQTLPVPDIGPDEVLIRLMAIGVGVWDMWERDGAFRQLFCERYGAEPTFPYVIGFEGAGTVVAMGSNVTRFQVGDRVYADHHINPKGGFYAEYVAVDAGHVVPIPDGLTVEEAGAMPVDAITALLGLDNVLDLSPGETVLIFGAGGGLGHLAVQLAKRMGARVFAVASGEDGVELVRRLGADAAVDGRKDDVASASRAFAPHGIDAALLTAGGEVAERALATLRDGGRIAYPRGVQPQPKARPGMNIKQYVGDDARLEDFEKLNRLISSGPFEVHIAQTFPLERAADAHQALGEHYLGKLVLLPGW
ncbi:quinone oxidoreductase family protein [Billgrantia sp. C5P2]|uniref:quinone oxidoreductase family protein n=1 Tax=Billgrantia sp. C5P2 TaxID=3436239 RepID=UPI003DA67901